MNADDVMYHEDLRVRHMGQNQHLAKRSSDAGWSAFLAILTCKAASAGKRGQEARTRSEDQRSTLRSPARPVLVAG